MFQYKFYKTTTAILHACMSLCTLTLYQLTLTLQIFSVKTDKAKPNNQTLNTIKQLLYRKHVPSQHNGCLGFEAFPGQ